MSSSTPTAISGQVAPAPIVVLSPNVNYTDEEISAKLNYESVTVDRVVGPDGIKRLIATPTLRQFTMVTERNVPKTGLLLVGLGGNNGTTVYAGMLANRLKSQWRTREGMVSANWFGSVCISSTVKLGADSSSGVDVYVPMNSLVPMLNPENLVISGWDINKLPLGDAMRRACVLDVNLQDQLYEEMQRVVPMAGVYQGDFIAANQAPRVDNALVGTKSELVEQLRCQIREFKSQNGLDKVIVLWTANTERFSELRVGLNDTARNLEKAIERSEAEIAPSTMYAYAAVMEGCSFVNGSPQNTLVPGLIELAVERGTFIAGDDFKTGQTKLKSVLVDYLVSAGIKPTSIVSYNHLGNNDGRNLDSYQQFRSKEISKSCVVNDIVDSSEGVLYEANEKPDHCVVIKYIPAVGDSKRAMDEFSSRIFLNGVNTIVTHNTCEDSLLAAPIIMDLVILTELCERMSFEEMGGKREKFHSVLSLLSYLCKAPLVVPGTPIVNRLFSQREAIVNFLRAAIGLPPENHMMLEHRLKNSGMHTAS